MLGVVDLADLECNGLRMLPHACRTCGISLSIQLAERADDEPGPGHCGLCTSIRAASVIQALPCVQPAEQFWKLYELFHIHDIEFDGVYLQGMLSQVPASSCRCWTGHGMRIKGRLCRTEPSPPILGCTTSCAGHTSGWVMIGAHPASV